MNGWDEDIYELKEADIPEITVPDSFDWRDHGKGPIILQFLEMMINKMTESQRVSIRPSQ